MVAGVADATGIGAPVPRVEDRRLLTGAGRFSDDMSRPNQVCAIMVRSEQAHAMLHGVTAGIARAMPGVLAVLTGQDWLDQGLNPMPAWGNPKDVELKNRDGREIFYTPLYPVATDRIRRVGEIVAMVVAETEAQARDAAEQIGLDMTPLPAVADAAAALAGDAPILWDEVPGNISVDDEKGNEAACDKAFALAAHIVRLETNNQRVTGVPMEPRAALGEFDAATGQFLLEAGGQGVIRFQNELAGTIGVDKKKIRVISRDVGGGYGTRNHTYPEFALVLWAARHTGRPVKWVCNRSEAFLSDYAGRDLISKVSLALDREGRFLAMRAENIANIGTHTVSYVPLARGPTVYNGVYRMPVAHVNSKAVLTNTNATASYRGAGRPESMFVIERLVDMAAAELGMDRVDLRLRNLIPLHAIPYTNGVNVTYDSGDFAKSMEMALEMSDWDGFAARQASTRSRGRLSGIGLANYIETATGYPNERAEMEIQPGGIVDLVMGTQSSGQGHETSYAQVVSHWLELPFDCVRLRTGDTDFVASGSGSHSSRSMRLAGHLYRQTCEEIIDRAAKIAAFVLEAASEDLFFEGGRFTIEGTDRSLHLFDIAEIALRDKLPEELRGRLRAVGEISAPLPTYPNGCHVAEVEIDPDTGIVEIVRYTGIDDVGRVINPLIVDGQTHGGIVQGVGQALMEHCLYDAESAQIVAGSFMDYCMPRADDVPSFNLANNEVPAPNNMLGVKGGGEGGTTAAPPA
ncbi:MAG: xanthine dehydrogenase family protein molybdopterin-binding subunit, partial [Proteobacteria bacterium]|nr:xanthine dehydrogenase family protein molybdopterin-binding subunit [Pseudomonadota bacterium]